MVGGAPAELLDAPGRLVVTPHPILLDGQRNVAAKLFPGESLEAFLLRNVPDIDSGAWAVSIGGLAVPRAMWRRTFPKHGQLIACRAVVQRSVLMIIAIAVLMYFTMGAGAGMVGLTAGSATAIGVFVAGAIVINKVLGPKVLDAATSAASTSQNDVYSLNSQRNTMRAYQPIGTLLGEMRVTPDLASQPYTGFESEEQYLSTMLLGGINVDSYSDLSVGDTPLSSYNDVTVYTNGFSGMASEDVPLFSNADTVAGGTLENTTEWVTRTSSADATVLQVDFEYQLFKQGTELENASLSVEAQFRLVGAPTWTVFNIFTYTNKTMETRRRTWSRDVALGQYEVRMRRNDGENPTGVTRSVNWTSLRTIQHDDTDYRPWGRIGIRIKATGQLSGSLDTLRANFRARPLPLWNGSAWVNATTRDNGLSNPGAQILQVLRGIYFEDKMQFGCGLADDQIDIDGLKAFMLHCTANGFKYDRWITATISLKSLLEEIALAGMGQFMWLDGSRPTVMFAADDQPLGGVVNMANMKRGTFSVNYQLTNAADGIEYQYVDRDKGFETVTLRVMAPGVTTMLNPAQLTGVGVTSEAHAALMARYHLGQSLYQYKEIGFGADIESLDYRRMSILSLSHDMTQWAYGGRLVAAAIVGGNIVLTLDEPVPSLPSRFVGLRVPGEKVYRVFSVQAFAGETDVITLIGSWPLGVLFPGSSAENPAHDTLWCYDVKATPGYRVRVVAIEPDGDLKGATVKAVPEGPEFWDYVMNGDYVPAPNQSLLPQLEAPAVSNIRITAQPNAQGNTEWVQFNVIWDSTGDLDHCQVWAAINGQPLRMVDGRAVGNRSSFRIDDNGEWRIEVRPFDPNGVAGAPESVLYTTSLVNRAPTNVDYFNVDEIDTGVRRYRFGYTGVKPAAYAGVQIRYRAGSTPIVVGDWDSLTPLGRASDVYTYAPESMFPAPGQWTFACRAISTAGVLSASVVQQTVTLGGAFLLPTLAIKRNQGSFTDPNYNECWLHGRDNSGAAADVPGLILVDGQARSVPNGLLYGSQGPYSGYIAWDMDSAGTFVIAGGGPTVPYAAVRAYAGVWQYDNNSVWTPFTPTNGHRIIGTIQSGAPDTGAPGAPPGIVAASMWASASTLDSLVSNAALPSIEVKADNLNANGAGFSGRYVKFSTGYTNGMSARGHMLAVYNPATDTVESFNNYDTYVSGAPLAALVAALAAVPAGRIVGLYTYDASSHDATLRTALMDFGGSGSSALWSGSRVSHAFVGQRGMLPGQAYEAISSASDATGVVTLQAYYTATTLVANGASGTNGTPGAAGADGQTSYLHIKYSNDGGTTFTASGGETPGAYMGQYTDFTLADSTSVGAYSWALIKGADGTNGTPGTPGADGTPSYLHIKWSNDGGSSFTASGGETPGAYIGTYTDANPSDSSSPSAYTWALVKGADGEDGIPGTPGADGTPSYLHIKWSDDGGATFTASSGETPGRYIGTYTDSTPADSSSVGAYVWALVKGSDGSNGANGADAVVMSLSAASAVLQADSTGLVSDWSPATTTAKVMKGSTDDSASWTFTRTNGSGVTSSLGGTNNQTLTVSAMTGDTGYVDVSASRTGYGTQTVRFTLAKARAATPAAGVVQPMSHYVEAETTSPTNPVARLGVNSTGTWWDDGTAWWYGGTPPAGLYVRVDIVTVSASGSTSGTFGTWLAVSTSPYWTLTRTTTGGATAFFNISFASDSAGATIIGTGQGQLGVIKNAP